MKDATQIALEATRLETSVSDTIAYCLNLLYADTQQTLTQEVVQGLTFEALLGTLLQRRDLHEQLQEMMEDEEKVAPYISAGLSQF